MNPWFKWGLFLFWVALYWSGLGSDHYPDDKPSWPDFWRWFNDGKEKKSA